MNCQSCNTTIDYRFLSNCLECGNEVRPESVPQHAIKEFSGLAVAKGARVEKPSWAHVVANVFYVLLTSLIGMISGAMVLYFTAGLFFMVMLSGGGNPSENCARGMAIGMLSILSGAFLGTVGGSAFATNYPLIMPQQDKTAA